MAQFNFDASTVAPQASTGPLPAGTYLAHITESDVQPLKSGNGEGLKLTFEIIDGQIKGRKVWENLNIRHSNEDTQRIAQSQLSGLEVLRSAKGMGIILIAHDKIKRIEDPLTEGYDSHVLKLHDKAAGLVQEWADVIGYAGYRIFTSKTDAGFSKKETKATTTGERILHVEPHPAHCGGNRFGLQNMPLDWTAFQAALTQAQS